MNIKDTNYIEIQGWMRTQLDLKGNELLVYAIIYGFSQTENQKFTGSLQYLADWCGATKQGILKNLQSLVDKGLICKNEIIDNGVKYCEYSIKHSCIVLNTVEYPVKHSLTNNIANNKEVYNKTLSKDKVEDFLKHDDISVKPKKQSLWDKCVSEINNFTDDEILREWLVEFLKKCLDNSKESGTPFYTNTFKGKLNKLKQLSTDNYIQRKIVMQTLDNGWAGFYALKEDKQYKKKDVFGEQGKVKSNGYTDEDEAEDERINKEREKKGMRTRF